ncbi:MAG: DNA translocase FtsK [Clostridia bacterium]|nr:DNA translocase FtsK [Clostridia bacterium]
MFSVILLALTFFPGESLWTVIHGFILGILGFKAFLWAGLLVYLGYLMTKQRNEFTVMNIIRPTAGIIVLTDVLGYILVQSNGYRNVYNELTFSILQLIGQIFRDGSKIGGTGLLGGSIGEILIGIAGKNGAAIITSIMLTAMIMVLSHTGPIELFEQTKRKIRWFLQPEHALRKPAAEDAVYGQKTVFQEEDFFDDGIDVDVDGLIEAESAPGQAETVDVDIDNEQPADEGEKSDLEDIVNKVSLKKKKKLTKAEEIQAQSEVISKQVESGENNSDAGEKEYKFPVTRLLVSPKNSGTSEDLKQELIETADKLIRTLEEYGVKASIHDISHGPTVTRYEIKPAPGVKINKIKNLSADIALRLAAQSIRIEAPIPGKAAVGIEIPNQNKQMVRIREIIGSKEFAEAKGSLVVALGKDIEGNIVLCDLTKMPHLLIAGSTGSGKSVCVNSMLISMLYKYSPADVRMVLIDPKSVEFDMYNGIPHLLVPVVCEPKKAAGALQWAVSEMLKRYSMLKERGARNIDGYNRIAEQTHEFEKLCRIVIVIDEMADLMIASPKEVEDAIARLAAMARAAGMYMVLATQRPSVDVITGTIKNNIPSRIALAVSSQIDSRTILDEGGAENLIGYGDMLFHPMGSSKHIRVQGCFVEDFEVERVINFVKQNGLAEYDDSIADEIERNSLDNSGESSAEFEGKDEFFEKAVEVVTEAGQASTSMLQRRLGVGYARAGRIIDQLEEHGIIGPHEGSKPRAVLLSRTQWLEMTMSRSHAGKNDPLLRNNSGFAAQTLDSGHEEISARQSEFFNADNSDEFDYEDEFEQEILSVSNTAESDGGIIVPEEEESDGEPAAESGSDSPETATDDAPDSFSVEQEEKEDRTVKGRDMSIFMEDVYDASDDLFDVADQSEIAEPSSVPGTESDVDIPPWEEIPEEPVRNKSSENVFVEDDTDDFAAFGEPEHIISVEDKNKAVITEDTDEEEDDNDDDDFILFSEPEKETPAKSGRKSVILDSEDDDDDLHAFSEPDRNPPAKKPPVRNDMLANGNDNADHDDDDLFDDILSSPWIKKL